MSFGREDFEVLFPTLFCYNTVYSQLLKPARIDLRAVGGMPPDPPSILHKDNSSKFLYASIKPLQQQDHTCTHY